MAFIVKSSKSGQFATADLIILTVLLIFCSSVSLAGFFQFFNVSSEYFIKSSSVPFLHIIPYFCVFTTIRTAAQFYKHYTDLVFWILHEMDMMKP